MFLIPISMPPVQTIVQFPVLTDVEKISIRGNEFKLACDGANLISQGERLYTTGQFQLSSFNEDTQIGTFKNITSGKEVVVNFDSLIFEGDRELEKKFPALVKKELSVIIDAKGDLFLAEVSANGSPVIYGKVKLDSQGRFKTFDTSSTAKDFAAGLRGCSPVRYGSLSRC